MRAQVGTSSCVLVVVLLLFGAPKLPELARSLGKSMRILKEETKALHVRRRARQRKTPSPSDEAQGRLSGSASRSPTRACPCAQHLAELRNRMVLSARGIAVGAVGGWFLFTPPSRRCSGPCSTPPQRDDALVTVNFSGLATALDMQLKVAIFLGPDRRSPWWLYQLWAFVAPGPRSGKERRYTVGFLGAAVPLFLGGVAARLGGVSARGHDAHRVRAQRCGELLDAQLYLTFAMRLLVAFGLAFVFPVVMVALTWVGIVPSRAWLKGWRWAVLLIFIFPRS